EPPTTGSKPAVISISPQEQKPTHSISKAPKIKTLLELSTMQLEDSKIPKEVLAIIQTLAEKGFEAYIVGGCVRDLILSRAPMDWDVTTNATPEEIQAAFSNTFYTNDF